MPDDWRTVTLADVLGAKGYIRGPFGSALRRAELLPTGGIPVYEQQHAIYHSRDFRFFIDEEKHRKLSRFTVQPNDLIISCSGTLGKVSVIRQEDPVGIISQALLLFRPDTSVIDPQFLFYFLSSPTGFHSMVSVSTGSVQVNIAKRSIIEGIEFLLPPLAEQRAIAAVLGALDGKIELNRRMNATLESMARALFQSWFVDFDPVRAKLDGRQPTGLEPATAALFPNEFEHSELGPVPKGWKIKSLPDVIEVNPRRKLQPGTIAPYLDMKNMPTHGHCPDEVIQRAFTSGTKFQKGDTLLARITPCLENGKTALVDFLSDGQIGWGSTEYIIFAPKPPLPPQFGYLLARSDSLRAHAIQNMTGTSGRQRVPPECFRAYPLTVPPPEVAIRFGEFTGPFFTTIKSNTGESRTLTELRDTLLPKLLSGEVGAIHNQLYALE
jgi:type I restriction enzyme S subunit